MEQNDYIYNYLDYSEPNSEGKLIISNGQDSFEVPIVVKEIFELLDRYKGNIEKVKSLLFLQYNEEINVEQIVETFEKSNFLVDKHISISSNSKKIGDIINKIMFSNISYIVFSFAIVVSVLQCLKKGFYYYINYEYIMPFKDNSLVSMIIYYLLMCMGVAGHEFLHYMIASGNGSSASISLGIRMQYLVAQTKIHQPYMMTKSEQIKTYIAGMYGDLLTVVISILILSIEQNAYIVGILRCLIYIKLSGILWQFLFYMKTDVYYIIEVLLGEKNLMSDAESYLVARGDYNGNVRIYSIFLVIGRVLGLGYYLLIQLPVLYNAFLIAIDEKNVYCKYLSLLLLISNISVYIITFYKTKVMQNERYRVNNR